MKAIGLFSGGLDSALAIKLIQSQGIEVIALNFTSPFCTCIGGCNIASLAKQMNVKIKLIKKGMNYIKMIRNPKYGYGKNLNPCVDCRIYILKKAKKYAKEINVKFIFTGEVLDQRPMSQHYKTLMLIEKDAGLEGKIVRPLCGGLLKPTEAEKKGWVNREKFLKIRGRRRIEQINFAKKLGIDGFLCGGSGCRLTNKEYANKLKDLFNNKKSISWRDIIFLNIGRHFRLGKNKIIVGRNKEENEILLKMKKGEYCFEAENVMGPVALLFGRKSKKAVNMAAKLTVFYSDVKENVNVAYDKGKIFVEKVEKEEIDGLRI